MGYYVFVLVNVVCACAWADQNKTGTKGNDPPILQKKTTVKPPPSPAASGPAPAVYLFDGKELNRDWKLLNPDADKWTMQPKRKSIMIETQTGSCLDPKTGKNLLVLNKQLPTEDFEVIVKASIQAQVQGNQISMILSSDPTNYFWILFNRTGWINGPMSVYFQKISQGQQAGSFENIVGTSSFYFRIVRDGNTYSGYYSNMDPSKPEDIDKIAWTGLGTFPWIRFQPKQLALCANNSQAPLGVAAEFYSVVIRKK